MFRTPGTTNEPQTCSVGKVKKASLIEGVVMLKYSRNAGTGSRSRGCCAYIRQDPECR